MSDGGVAPEARRASSTNASLAYAGPSSSPLARLAQLTQGKTAALILLTRTSELPKLPLSNILIGRRSQVAKAADCKSAIVGSNPTGASFPRLPTHSASLCTHLERTRFSRQIRLIILGYH